MKELFNNPRIIFKNKKIMEENKEQLMEEPSSEAQVQEEVAQQAGPSVENAEGLFQESIEALEDYDGFILFEDSIEDVDSLDPSRPAKRNRFLTSPDKQLDREKLQSKLELWLRLIEGNEDLSDLITSSERHSEEIETSFNQNLKAALDATRDLEIAYRTVGAFFSNAGDSADKVMFLNAAMEDLTNLDKSRSYEALKAKFEETYNNFDLENAIGALVIPGYLGSKAAINKYCLLYTSPSPRDRTRSRMPSSA